MKRIPSCANGILIDSESFLRAAERVRNLSPCQHHSCLDTERLARSLERAAERPNDPKSVELFASLPLVLYVSVT